jgi:predicted lipid-binding transport protein (Tim44 family)
MTTGISTLLIFLTMCLSIGAVSLGCAAPRSSTRAVSQAELAVQDATVSEADAYAPADLRLAREKLDRAQAAYDDGEYDRARRLAEEALVDAQLAEARAENEQATTEARRLESDVEVLHRRFPAHDHDHGYDD